MKFDYLMAIGCSRLGLTIEQFFEFTPREFIFALRDKQEIMVVQNKMQLRTIFESMRLQTMIIYNTNPYAKKKFKDVRKFMPFGWDEKSKVQTVDDMKSTLISIAKRFTKKKKRK